MELTADEKKFLISLLSQIQVSCSDPDAVKAVTSVQGILGKLKAGEVSSV